MIESEGDRRAVGKNAAPAAPQPKPAGNIWGRASSAFWLVVLAAVLTLHVWFPPLDAGTVNDTYNVDIGGRNAIYQFVERRAIDAGRNHESLPDVLDANDTEMTLCLLGPARYPSPREWKAILEWVEAGGKLLLAARWDDPALAIPGVDAHVTSTVQPDEGLFGLRSLKPAKPQDSAAPPAAGPAGSAAGPKNDAGATTPSTPAAPAQPNWTSLLGDANFTWKTKGIIDAPRAEILVKTGESPQAVRMAHGNGTIVLLASDFIFSNAALFERDRHNGLLAVKLFEAAGATDAVLFDESLNATGTPRVVGVLLDPALRPTTIQVVVVLVIFGWMGNRRFGGLSPASSPARHDVADHTNSLGNLYYKAHHGTGALREYLEQFRTELKLRHAAGPAPRALLPIAQKAQLTLEEVQRLLAEADAAARKPKLSRREAAAMIRKLAHLRRAAHRA